MTYLAFPNSHWQIRAQDDGVGMLLTFIADDHEPHIIDFDPMTAAEAEALAAALLAAAAELRQSSE